MTDIRGRRPHVPAAPRRKGREKICSAQCHRATPRLYRFDRFAAPSASDRYFFASTSTKLFDGGWFPLLIAFIISFLMLTWRKGEELMDAVRLEIRQPSKGHCHVGDFYLSTARSGHRPQTGKSIAWRAPAWYWTPPKSAILGQRDNAKLRAEIVSVSEPAEIEICEGGRFWLCRLRPERCAASGPRCARARRYGSRTS